jgi:hypothetical protein
MRPPIIVAALLAYLCLVAACGAENDNGAPTVTSSPAAPPAGTGEPADGGGDVVLACSLLTPEEVEQALGEPVGEPIADRFGEGFSSCTYETESLDVVRVRVFTAEDRDAVREYFEFGSEELEPVEGLGDAATWSDAFRELEVLRGNYDVSIEISYEGGGIREKAETLMRIALERLPQGSAPAND